MFKLIRRILFLLCLLISSPQLFAAELDVLISNPIPTTVPQYGKVSLFYNINNLTNTNVDGIRLKKLPPNVTQVTYDANYCGAIFNLGPQGTANQSCILKLTVKAPVIITPANLLVCTTHECDGPSSTHQVTLGPALPFMGIGSGNYIKQNMLTYPLLAVTADSGATWIYPPTLLQNLQQEIDPKFVEGKFLSASCNNSLDENVCISAGDWCDVKFYCHTSFPLIAVGLNAANWFYPKQVFENLTTVVDSNFVSGSLSSSSCFGSGKNTICLAGGTYSTNTATLPLLARTEDAGHSWTYPKTIFKNLTTEIDPSFASGALRTVSCTKSPDDSLCITAGNFWTANWARHFPLLAVSTDKGVTWVYPAEIHQDLNIKLDPTFSVGLFASASCAGKGAKAICIAAGDFGTSTNTLPLLVLTRDGGKRWAYPREILTNLGPVIKHGFIHGALKATSCSGSGNKTICIAVGHYLTKGRNHERPLLALTKNGGLNWSYPDFIYTKLKVMDPTFRNGYLEGASCIGSGKTAICVASGWYHGGPNGGSFPRPLIARSADGGKTWSYPSSVLTNALSLPGFIYGELHDVSCKGTPAHNLCIASGEFTVSRYELPMITISHDSGKTWTYPEGLYTNITTKVDPDFFCAEFMNSAMGGAQFKFKYKNKFSKKTDSIMFTHLNELALSRYPLILAPLVQTNELLIRD